MCVGGGGCSVCVGGGGCVPVCDCDNSNSDCKRKRRGNNYQNMSLHQLNSTVMAGRVCVHLVLHVGQVHGPDECHHIDVGHTEMRRNKVEIYHL